MLVWHAGEARQLSDCTPPLAESFYLRFPIHMYASFASMLL